MTQPNDDMEGVADDEAFEAAATFLGSAVTSGDKRFDDQAKLAFYGLYKQATVGKCNIPKPGFLDFAGRSKWDAWNKLEGLSREDAMQQYVERLRQLVPEWRGPEAGGKAKAKGAGGMGPVFSCLAAADEPEQDSGPQTLHELAGQDDLPGVQRLLAAGSDLEGRDEAGCTALHFAADRGNGAMASALIGAGAALDAQDDEGQTPLHYAAITEHREVYELLLKAGASASIKDAQGQTASEVAPAAWANR